MGIAKSEVLAEKMRLVAKKVLVRTSRKTKKKETWRWNLKGISEETEKE